MGIIQFIVRMVENQVDKTMDSDMASEVIALYRDNYQYGPSFPV